MKQKLAVVLTLILAVAILAIFGLVPGEHALDDTTGQAVRYFPESDFGVSVWKPCCTGDREKEEHSDRYMSLLERRLEGDHLDYTLKYDNHFDLFSGDGVVIGQQTIWFLRSQSLMGPTYSGERLALLSMPHESRRSRSNIENTVAAQEDKEVNMWSDLTVIADEVVDADYEGHIGDRVTLVFPGISTLTYTPVLNVGDVRLINGKEVELKAVTPAAPYTEFREDGGVAVLRVGQEIGTVDSFVPTTIGGLTFTMDKVERNSQSGLFYFNDVFSVDI